MIEYRNVLYNIVRQFNNVTSTLGIQGTATLIYSCLSDSAGDSRREHRAVLASDTRA